MAQNLRLVLGRVKLYKYMVIEDQLAVLNAKKNIVSKSFIKMLMNKTL